MLNFQETILNVSHFKDGFINVNLREVDYINRDLLYHNLIHMQRNIQDSFKKELNKSFKVWLHLDVVEHICSLRLETDTDNENVNLTLYEFFKDLFTDCLTEIETQSNDAMRANLDKLITNHSTIH